MLLSDMNVVKLS